MMSCCVYHDASRDYAQRFTGDTATNTGGLTLREGSYVHMGSSSRRRRPGIAALTNRTWSGLIPWQ